MTRDLNNDDLMDIDGGTPNTNPEFILQREREPQSEDRVGGGGAGSNLIEEELPGSGSGIPEYKG